MTDSHVKISFSGPGYITKAVHTLAGDVQKIVTSRRHRKGRGALIVTPEGVTSVSPQRKYPWLHFWAPARLTWWVAVLFIIGSGLFSLGGYAISFPEQTDKIIATGINVDWVFFIGSVFFTLAALCQLLEAMNAGDSDGLYTDEDKTSNFQWLTWHPQRIGYMASLTQLIGTVMFNFNTVNIFIDDLNWVQQDILIWLPNIIGCLCFLIASRLAFMEVCHGYWGWQPGNIEWWITVLNLLGSIGFMISALYGLAVPPGDSSATFSWLSALFTFQGGLCFFIASYLLLPEMFSE
jgi:hypothetical protein